MLRKIIRNKLLYCLLFVASVFHPAEAKTADKQVEEFLESCIKAANAREMASKEKSHTEVSYEQDLCGSVSGKVSESASQSEEEFDPDTEYTGESERKDTEEVFLAMSEEEVRKKIRSSDEEVVPTVGRLQVEDTEFYLPGYIIQKSSERVHMPEGVYMAVRKPDKVEPADIIKVGDMNFYIPKGLVPEEKTEIVATAQKPTENEKTVAVVEPSLQHTDEISKPVVQQDLIDLLNGLSEEPSMPSVAKTEPISSVKTVPDSSVPKTVSESVIQQDLADLLNELSAESPVEAPVSGTVQVASVHEEPSAFVSKTKSVAGKAIQPDIAEALEYFDSEPGNLQVAVIEKTENEKGGVESQPKNEKDEPAVSVAQVPEAPVSGEELTAPKAETVVAAVLPVISEDGKPATAQKDLLELLSDPSMQINSSDLPSEQQVASVKTEKPVKPVETTVTAYQSTKDQIEELLSDPIMQASQKEEQAKANVAWVRNLEKNIAGFLTSVMLIGALCHAVGSVKEKKILPKVVSQKPVLPAEESKPSEKTEGYVGVAEKIIFKPEEKISSKDERKILSEHIWGLKAVDEVKRRRAVLTREMAKAKRAGDEQKIAEIQAERQMLSAKRKAACLRITGPDMARIKEQRRLLTKRMTIARRQKDQETMNQITAERLVLKEQVMGMNSYIRAFNYQKQRKDLIKPSTLRLIYFHQKEYARAA